MYLHRIDISRVLNGKNQQFIQPLGKNKRKKQFYIDIKRMPIELALIKGLGIKSCLTLVRNTVKNSIKMKLPGNVNNIFRNLKKIFAK